jgi:hypothetical protein
MSNDDESSASKVFTVSGTALHPRSYKRPRDNVTSTTGPTNGSPDAALPLANHTGTAQPALSDDQHRAAGWQHATLHGSFLTHSISDRKSRRVTWLIPNASAADSDGDTPVTALCQSHADVLLRGLQCGTSDRTPAVSMTASSSLSTATTSQLPQIVEEVLPVGRKVSISAAGHGVYRPVADGSTNFKTCIESFMRQVQRADAFQVQKPARTAAAPEKRCDGEEPEAACRLQASPKTSPRKITASDVGAPHVPPRTCPAFKSSSSSLSGGLPLNADKQSLRACDAQRRISNMVDSRVGQRQTDAAETNSSTHPSKTAAANGEETHTTADGTAAPGARDEHWNVADLMAALDDGRLRSRVVEARRQARRSRQQPIDCTMTSSLDRHRLIRQVAPAVVGLSTCSPYFVSATQQNAGGSGLSITESPAVAPRSTPAAAAADRLLPRRSNSFSATVVGRRNRWTGAELSASSSFRISVSDSKRRPANSQHGATKADAAEDETADDSWPLQQRVTPRELESTTAGSRLLLQRRSRQLRKNQGTICAADRRKCASLPAVLSVDGAKSNADAVRRSMAVPLLRRGAAGVDGGQCKRVVQSHDWSYVPSANGNDVAVDLMTVGLAPMAAGHTSRVRWSVVSKRTADEQYERDNRP